jgi:hypothetical protein
MSAGGYFPHQVVARIKALRQFIGPERLKDLIQAYLLAQQRGTGVEIYRLREHQPLIEGFDAYRRATFGRRQPMQKIGPELHALANIAGNYAVVAPTLPPDLAEHQRDKLVNFDGLMAPQLLEWTTASAISRVPDCEIAWFPVHATGPEFAVRGAGLEWEMECKRLSPMVVELLGESEAGRFAGRVLEFLHREGWQGQLDLTVPPERPNDSVAEDVVTALRSIDFSAPVEKTLPSGIQVRAQLRRKTGTPRPAQDWQAAINLGKRHDSRLYAMGSAQADMVLDPLVLQLAGPQRTADQLIEHLWERKFRKAASQCTSGRAAALVFEWQGIGEARIFQDSPVMQQLMERTFDDFRNLAFIAMRCVQPPRKLGRSIDFSVNGYSAISKVTQFPDVASLLQRSFGK